MGYARAMADADMVFLRYRDHQGRDVVTNDITEVPVELRGAVARLRPPAPTPRERAEAAAAARVASARAVFGAAPQLHGPSFALGAVVAFAVAWLVFGLRGARRALVRVVVVGVGILLIGGLYFGWVLRTAGLDQGALASPRAALDEARRARAQVEQRSDELHRVDEALAHER